MGSGHRGKDRRKRATRARTIVFGLGWLALPAILLGLLNLAPVEAKADDSRAKIRAELEEALRRRREILERILAIGSGLDTGSGQGPTAAGSLEFYRAPRLEAAEEPPLDAFDPGMAVGPFPWSDELLLLQWTLDLDADGRPEEVRYLDPESTELLRRHVDRNGDGRIDSWESYRDGALFQRELDDDHDGRIDAREEYVGDVLSLREVDRDQDGAMDLRRIYRDGWLAEERFDSNNDGVWDIIVFYRDGKVVERDHDVDGDGEADVVSFYRDGRLVRRELHSVDLVPDSLPSP